jgi:hypothetical protein
VRRSGFRERASNLADLRGMAPLVARDEEHPLIQIEGPSAGLGATTSDNARPPAPSSVSRVASRARSRRDHAAVDDRNDEGRFPKIVMRPGDSFDPELGTVA